MEKKKAEAETRRKNEEAALKAKQEKEAAEIKRKADVNIKKYNFIANQVEKEILERRQHHE